MHSGANSNGKSGMAQRAGQRKIVAHGAVPEFKHVALLELFPANRCAASPSRNFRGDPRGKSRWAHSRPKPARSRFRRFAERASWEGRHRAKLEISSGATSCCSQPRPGPYVESREDVDIKSFCGLRNRHAKVVHFFSAIAGLTGDHDIIFAFAGRGGALNDFARRVIGVSPWKENLVVHIE